VRLAWRQGLTVGPEARLVATAATTTTEATAATTTTEATAATTATTTATATEATTTATVATEARTAVAAIATTTAATRAARTAGTAGTSRSTVTPITTWTARTSGASRATGSTARATAPLAAEIARRRGELPADAGAWHLAAARPVVVLRRFLGGAVHEAAQPPRLVAPIPPGASGASATATTAATTAATAAAVTAATAVAAASIVAAAPLRRRHAVDGVVELAARDRAVRPLLALEHANQANLVEPVADDVERLDHPGGPVRRDPHRARDRVGDRIGLLLDRRIAGGRIGGIGGGRIGVGGGRVGSGGLRCCRGITWGGVV
jgi:hypothetical protein